MEQSAVREVKFMHRTMTAQQFDFSSHLTHKTELLHRPLGRTKVMDHALEEDPWLNSKCSGEEGSTGGIVFCQ